MTRHAHLWFIAGFLMAAGTCLAMWMAVLVAGQLWTTNWAWVFGIAEVVMGVMTLRTIRTWSKWRERRFERISRELPCREKRFLHTRQLYRVAID